MSEPFLGEIRMFGGNFAPLGWAFCSGQLLPISQNDALFALIGTTYGGDGQTTFGLPDLRGRAPVHQGQGPGLDNYVLGQMSGTEQETLTVSQIPGHTHFVNTTNAPATVSSPGGGYLAKTPGSPTYALAAPSVLLKAGSIGSAGGSQPHDNMMPSLGVSYIIALEGIFPSQN